MIEKLGDKFCGLMAFDIREAIWLAKNGFRDIVVGYPQFDRKSLELINGNDILKIQFH